MLLSAGHRLRPALTASWSRVGRIRSGFRTWRRRRPFWGAFLLVVAGLMVLIPPYASFRIGDMAIAIGTIGGVSSVLIGGLLVVIGVALWLRPEFRLIGGIAGGLLALVSFVTTNLGGLVLGMLLGLVGAALLIAWTDEPRAADQPHPTDQGRSMAEPSAESPPESEVPAESNVPQHADMSPDTTRSGKTTSTEPETP